MTLFKDIIMIVGIVALILLTIFILMWVADLIGELVAKIRKHYRTLSYRIKYAKITSKPKEKGEDGYSVDVDDIEVRIVKARNARHAVSILLDDIVRFDGNIAIFGISLT